MLWIMSEQRRGIEDGFNLTDLRFDPIQIAKVLLLEKLPGTPIGRMHREILEMVRYIWVFRAFVRIFKLCQRGKRLFIVQCHYYCQTFLLFFNVGSNN